MSSSFAGMARSINVFGKPLQAASGPGEPTTGFFRDGYCNTGPQDMGKHTVAGIATTEFLEFSAKQGNDLRGIVTPGCTWCFCVNRWLEAFRMKNTLGEAIVQVKLDATHQQVLDEVSLEDLKKNAAPGPGSI